MHLCILFTPIACLLWLTCSTTALSTYEPAHEIFVYMGSLTNEGVVESAHMLGLGRASPSGTTQIMDEDEDQKLDLALLDTSV